MRIITKDGKTVEVSDSYCLRLIEQGKAVAAPAGTIRKARQAEAPAKAGRGEKTAGVEDGAERPNL